jgi:hypothetical protein
MNRFI